MFPHPSTSPYLPMVALELLILSDLPSAFVTLHCLTLPSTIALLQATAIQLSDFTNMGAGYCVDSVNETATYISSPNKVYTDDAAMDNYCISYCGQ
jgi:hypothetical protein